MSMALTNAEIIHYSKVAHKINEEVDTYPGWKRRGRQVCIGSKALFKTSIWVPIQRKSDATEVEASDDSEPTRPDMKLVNTAFFGESQTEEYKPSESHKIRKAV